MMTDVEQVEDSGKQDVAPDQVATQAVPSAGASAAENHGHGSSITMALVFAILTFLLMTFMPGYNHMTFPGLIANLLSDQEVPLVNGPVVDFCILFLFVQWVIALVYLIRACVARSKKGSAYRDVKGALTFESIFCVPFAAYTLETAVMYIPWKGKLVMDFVNATADTIEYSVMFFLASLAVLIIAGAIFLHMAKDTQTKSDTTGGVGSQTGSAAATSAGSAAATSADSAATISTGSAADASATSVAADASAADAPAAGGSATATL